ncbi:MAG: MMPL family transporter [Flavobacteriales bacterium]|nr:MMPL family transporter [Flavobacteriales bacterium]
MLKYREKVQDIFGLKDPIVIGVFNENGIYNRETLQLISRISDSLANIQGINSDQITSISTEKNITGTESGMTIEPFYDMESFEEDTPEKVRKSLANFEVYQGNLVSQDGKMTLIISELLEDSTLSGKSLGSVAYDRILNLVNSIDPGESELHVAGIGAVEDALMNKIDSDAMRLNPLIGLFITLVLILAYRTWRGAVIPNIIVAATAVGALGIMAAMEVEFFVITNALPPILIAIAVADSIHIFGQYYEEKQAHPHLDKQSLIVKTMETIWRPVFLTSITTISGFIGIALTSSMPPFTYFGWFAALGVLIALVYSLSVLPAALMIGNAKPSKAFQPEARDNDFFSKLMWNVGRRVISNPKRVLIVAAVLILIAVPGALNLRVDYAPIDNFKQKDAIFIADQLINKHMNGTTTLDIIVETDEVEGLYQPKNLNKIDRLQRWLPSIEHINGSTSIVDIIKKVNQSLNSNDKAYFNVPDDELLVSQEVFLYGASSDPTELEKYVDTDYKTANIRVYLNDAFFQTKKNVSLQVQKYLDNHFNGEGLQASLSGNVAVDYEYMKDLGKNHFVGTGVALLLILIVSGLVFKSFSAGIYATAPIAIAILAIYAIMGYFNISMGIGTTMFSAIAIGLGVDFAIHTIERLVYFLKDKGLEKNLAFKQFYLSTGRALLFNLIALIFGFGLLMTSSVNTLIDFGLLLVVAVLASFLSSLTLLPAMIYITNPKFVGLNRVIKSKATPLKP